MEHMKTTFITTVFNEEKTIEKFLDSLYEQSVLPDEISIVDAGSKDKTAHIIQEYFDKHTEIPSKLHIKPGNRSVGRNEAIKHATGNIILCSDAGCILGKNWIKHLLEKFDLHVDVVSGYYKPTMHTVFERCLATYTCVMPDKLNEQTFLPSSRSIAFTKTAWEIVGGYPEYLNTCEDLVFAKKLKKKKLQFAFAEHAIVHWSQQKNFIQAAKQFFSYARGDGNAFYIRPQTPFLYGRYFILWLLFLFLIPQPHVLGILVICLFILYSLWAIGKNYRYVKHWQAIYLLPALQITADIAVMSGTFLGLIEY
jgi:glycosyltransferase involved in cell wall biosynthesis